MRDDAAPTDPSGAWWAALGALSTGHGKSAGSPARRGPLGSEDDAAGQWVANEPRLSRSLREGVDCRPGASREDDYSLNALRSMPQSSIPPL